jgi:PAS domain S-box-containing protein
MEPRPDYQAEARALRESEDRYARLIREAPDPIVTLDLIGRVQTVNPAVEQAVGYAAEEILGRHFSTLGILRPSSLPRAIEEFAFALAGAKRPPFELDVAHKDGTPLTFEANPRSFSRNDTVAGVHVIFRDITGRRRAEEALRTETEKLERLGKLMVSRDRRITELQQEVDRLLAELGRPPRYADR